MGIYPKCLSFFLVIFNVFFTLHMNFNFGINCQKGNIDNMIKLRVFETLLSKQQQLQVATQMANAILRIDDIINI